MTKERGQTLCDALAVAMAKRSDDPRIIVDWPMQPAVDRVILAEAETTIRNAALEEAADVIFNESVKHYAEGKSISDPYLSAVQLARADGLALASSAIRAMKEPT